jgi:parvulin-like peptidyl-prolyl isomerase
MPAEDTVTEEEVRQRFEQEGFDRERKMSRIVAPDRATINMVVHKLKSGQPFEEVARAHSTEGNSAQQGGGPRHVARPTIDRLQIPPDLFKSLADGEVSRPVPAGSGTWQVVRFADTVPVSFSKYATLIGKSLIKQQRIQVRKQHLETLANSYNVRLEEGGLTELMEAYRRQNSDALATSSSPLFHHDKGIVTVAEADEVLVDFNPRRIFANSTEAVNAVRSAVLYPRLIELEALAAGLFDTPDIRAFRQQKRVEILAEQVRNLAMADIEVSEEEIRQCYDANPGAFRIEGFAHVEELLLPTEATATEIHDRIASGEKLIDLVAHSLRSDAQKEEAQFHFHRQVRQIKPKLMAAIEAAPDGVLTGPVEVEGGYSVFRVLERVPESKQAYSKARPRARALLVRQRQAEEFDHLIVELRRKYETQVLVHTEELTAALPNGLLQGS